MIKAFLFLFICLPVLFNPQNPALASSADEFNNAIEAFNQGNYNKALQLFIKAEQAGLNTAQLHYNLGAVYYRLKEYNSSKRYFEKLLGNPALGFEAQYSLALIEHKTGNKEKAVELFRKCLQLTEQPELIALVTKQIDTLKGKKTAEYEKKNWFLYLSPGYGYDSNITHTPSSIASNKSDTFLQAILYAETSVYSSGINRVDLSLTHYSKNYHDNDDFNLSTSSLSASYHDKFRNWQMAYGMELGRSTFSGDDYLSNTDLFVRSKQKLAKNEELRLELKYQDISNLSNLYDFIDGNRTALKSEYRIKNKVRETDYIYQFEVNDRENTATQNFSPTRHLIGFRYQQYFRDKLKAAIRLDYRDSDYESTAFQNRRDRRSRVGLKSTYQISPLWGINLEALYTRNHSSEDASDYSNRVVTISMSALF